MNRIWGYTLIGILYCTTANALDDMSDIDAGVEESMADSVAAKNAARASDERASRERDETAEAIKKAERAGAAAEAKRQEAQRELQRSDKEIQAEKEKQAQLVEEIRKHRASIASSEEKIKVMTAKLEKTKAETQTAITLRDENLARIAELDKKERELIAANQMADQKLAQSKLEYEKSKLDQKARGERFTETQADSTQKRGALKAQLREGKTRMPNRVPAAAGVRVGSPSLDRQTFARDCKVLDKPDAGGKILGTKRAGSVIVNAKPENNWVGFPLRDGRRVFVEKNCF